MGNPKEFTIKELAELVIDMTESKSKAPLPVLIQPGPRNSLADVVGLFVGNAVDLNALTGVVPSNGLYADFVRTSTNPKGKPCTGA